MLTNLYQPPATESSLDKESLRTYRTLSLASLVIALTVALLLLSPLLRQRASSWHLDEWLIVFLPPVYFLIASAFSLATEFTGSRVLASKLSIVLLPLVAITGLILVTIVWYTPRRGIGFLYDWRTVFLLTICPLVWLYFALCVRRWLSIRLTQKLDRK